MNSSTWPDRSNCWTGPSDNAEAQLIAREWILNKFENLFVHAFREKDFAGPVLHLCRYCEAFIRNSLSEYLPQIWAWRSLTRPFTCPDTHPAVFAFSVCRAVQTDLNGRVVQQLSATHGVELLFLWLEKPASQPSKSSLARDHLHGSCAHFTPSPCQTLHHGRSQQSQPSTSPVRAQPTSAQLCSHTYVDNTTIIQILYLLCNTQ